MKVQLMGGPMDGLVMDVADNTPGLKFARKDSDIVIQRIGQPPETLPLGAYIYQDSGLPTKLTRDRAFRYIGVLR